MVNVFQPTVVKATGFSTQVPAFQSKEYGSGSVI